MRSRSSRSSLTMSCADMGRRSRRSTPNRCFICSRAASPSPTPGRCCSRLLEGSLSIGSRTSGCSTRCALGLRPGWERGSRGEDVNKLAQPAFDAYDVEAIRADFPILAERPYGKPLVYLDNAASAQKPKKVIDRLTHAYEHEYANVHRGLHYLANAATEAYEAARETVRRF